MGTAIPGTFNGLLTGLLGNFDGILTNDFILPNGTVLENKKYKEKEVYYNYGQHCKYNVEILWSFDGFSLRVQWHVIIWNKIIFIVFLSWEIQLKTQDTSDLIAISS